MAWHDDNDDDSYHNQFSVMNLSQMNLNLFYGGIQILVHYVYLFIGL